jgi:hypothetical protein
MNRRHFLRTTAGIATTTTAGLAGCLGSAAATGTLATRVSDRPGDIGDFESCVVTVTGVRVEPTDGEPATHEVSPADLDLTDLTGERSALVSELELDVGTYESLQLQVSETTGTLKDGTTPDVSVPGSAPLTFQHQFEIRESQRTTFTADVVPVRAGGSGKYLLKPVAEEVQVSYEAAGTTGTTTAETTANSSGGSS